MAEGRAVAEKQIKAAIDEKETVDFIMLNLRKLESGEYENKFKLSNLIHS